MLKNERAKRPSPDSRSRRAKEARLADVVLSLQRSHGNAAVARAVQRRRLQRTVGFDPGALAAPVFRALNFAGHIMRPPWVGAWAGAPGAAGQSRNHIVPYNAIAEALVNVSNAIWATAAAGGGVGAHSAALQAMSDALYPNPALHPAEHGAMTANRAALVTALTTVGNYGAPTGAEQTAITTAATALESDLMSAPQNVRLGDANINLRVGGNVDPQIGGVNVAGAPIPTFAGGPIGAGTAYLTMAPVANAMVYRFLSVATPYMLNDVTIVRNDDLGNPMPGGYAWDAPISSDPLPMGTAAQPVVVTDPAGAGLAYRFG